jgi:hypothetical protein
MLEHLSAKFRTPPQASLLEPRAALILNRFTRTLTVMYATNAVSSILGVTPEQLKDKSFYECIQETCLPEAIRCLESAKANDSIAYLRFWYRDPRRIEDFEEEMLDDASSDSEDGGVELTSPPDVKMEIDSYTTAEISAAPFGNSSTLRDDHAPPNSPRPHSLLNNSRLSSGESTDLEQDSSQVIFSRPEQPSRCSNTTDSEDLVLPVERRRGRRSEPPPPPPVAEPHEIEAVVSCTSDGLVVVLRRARPVIPSLQQHSPEPRYTHGLFAAPWGANPIRPHVHQFNPQYPFRHGLLAPQLPTGGPPVDEFMNSIREVAVFAWSLTGINGNIASYGHGTPRGESLPPGGLPIWDPFAQPIPEYTPPENQAAQRWSRLGEKMNDPPGNMVSYQHAHQEANFRLQDVYGNVPRGSDRAAPVYGGSFGDQHTLIYSPEVQAEQSASHSLYQQGGWPTSTSIPAHIGAPVRSPQIPGRNLGRGNRHPW